MSLIYNGKHWTLELRGSVAVAILVLIIVLAVL